RSVMWMLILIHAIGYVAAQSFLRPEKIPELSAAQIASCQLTGLISADDSCCHFIKCDLNQNVGWKFPCLGKTVWNSQLCSCVPEKTYRSCDRSQCPTISLPGTTAPCPIDLGSDECCLKGTGQIFRGDESNSSVYYYQGELDFQICPEGQIFELDSCCCEGPVGGIPKPCITYEYNGNFVDSDQNVHGDPDGVVITRPGFKGAGSASFGEGASLEVPYFSNAYMGIRFAAATYFSLDSLDEESDGLLFHNGEEDGVAATVKMEIMSCKGVQYLVAGVSACDRVEDILITLTGISTNTWYRAFLTFNEGNMEIGYSDADGIVIASEEIFEPDPIPTPEIMTFLDCLNERTKKSLDRTLTAMNDVETDTAEERNLVDEAKDCLDEIKTYLDALDDFTTKPEDAIGLTALRKTTKALKPIVRRCRRGKTIDVNELNTLTKVMEDTIEKVNEIITNVKAGLVKLCELKENKKLYRDILESPQRKELNVLKRKLRRAADAIDKENPVVTGGNNPGKFDILLEEAQACQAKQGRKKRDIENDQIPSIATSKHPLVIGPDFLGTLDHTQFCFDGELPE
ncbi:unnamed protein product, partial [Owenia fusiformis]